jgi:hypothetical protein
MSVKQVACFLLSVCGSVDSLPRTDKSEAHAWNETAAAVGIMPPPPLTMTFSVFVLYRTVMMMVQFVQLLLLLWSFMLPLVRGQPPNETASRHKN